LGLKMVLQSSASLRKNIKNNQPITAVRVL
jgi:hypothetical protein